jgi:uncharacterized membrane protein
MDTNKQVLYSTWLIRISYALFLFVIGIDKIAHLNLIGNWEQFAGPVIHTLLPVPTSTIVTVEGIVEIVLCIALLSKWFRVGVVVFLATTFLIWIDLVVLHFYNLALRDLLLGVGSVVLLLLTTKVLRSQDR